MDKLTQEQMQQMINRFIRNKLDEFERSRIEDGWTEPSQVEHNDKMLKGMIEMNQADLVQTEYMNAKGQVNKILEREGVSLDSESFEYKAMCRKYLLSEIEMYRVEKKRNLADYSDDVDKLFPLNGSGGDLPKEKESNSIPLSKLVDEYWKRKQAGWGGAAQESYERYSRRLLEHFHGTTLVDSITYENMEHFRDQLKETGNRGNPTSIKTVNLHLEFYSGLFNHAKLTGRIRHNPVNGVKFSDKRDQQTLNEPFPNEDLDKLFRSDQYIHDSFDKGWKFWLPILLLYTGARLEEVCQLYVDGIKKVDGLWVFDIDETRPDQSVKAHEKRYIPLHPFVVDDLKFINYVQNLPDQSGRLFYELNPVISKSKRPGGKERLRYGHYPSSNWFPPYKRKCGVVAPKGKKTIHSFRHNVSSRLMEQDVQEYVIAMALGHKHPQISTGRYGKKFEPKMLMEKAFSKLDFHKQIDLSHLKNSKYVIK